MRLPDSQEMNKWKCCITAFPAQYRLLFTSPLFNLKYFFENTIQIKCVSVLSKSARTRPPSFSESPCRAWAKSNPEAPRASCPLRAPCEEDVRAMASDPISSPAASLGQGARREGAITSLQLPMKAPSSCLCAKSYSFLYSPSQSDMREAMRSLSRETMTARC